MLSSVTHVASTWRAANLAHAAHVLRKQLSLSAPSACGIPGLQARLAKPAPALQIDPPDWSDGSAEWQEWLQRRRRTKRLRVRADVQRRTFWLRLVLHTWRFCHARNAALRRAWTAAVANHEALLLWSAFIGLRVAVQLQRKERAMQRGVLHAWRAFVRADKQSRELTVAQLLVRTTGVLSRVFAPAHDCELHARLALLMCVWQCRDPRSCPFRFDLPQMYSGLKS